MTSTPVIQLRGLIRRYGETLAADHLDLEFAPGVVHGLVGINGAGKTTMIKHILGLLKPQSGQVRVFGLDPVLNPVEVLGRVGYLSEDRELPEWMRVDELLAYTQAFYPSWDSEYADELVGRFGLALNKRVKELSKGMRAQTGLIAAAAHHPDLLLLDEPSTGLDPVVRRDILNAIVRAVADEGRTVLFSSHLLDEVEQMSDTITMIHRGQAVLQDDVDAIKQNHHQIAVRFSVDVAQPDEIPGVLAAEQQGDTWLLTTTGTLEEQTEQLASNGVEVLNARNATLQEAFIARVGRDSLSESDDFVSDKVEAEVQA